MALQQNRAVGPDAAPYRVLVAIRKDGWQGITWRLRRLPEYGVDGRNIFIGIVTDL